MIVEYLWKTALDKSIDGIIFIVSKIKIAFKLVLTTYITIETSYLSDNYRPMFQIVDIIGLFSAEFDNFSLIHTNLKDE